MIYKHRADIGVEGSGYLSALARPPSRGEKLAITLCIVDVHQGTHGSPSASLVPAAQLAPDALCMPLAVPPGKVWVRPVSHALMMQLHTGSDRHSNRQVLT